MKGIAHFSMGVAAAACFPGTAEAGADGNPLYFLLGGVFGLLPDTFDFKFYRFFYRHDVEVTPDPRDPDAGLIADALAQAFAQAHGSGRPVRVKLNTIRHGADLWERYSVRFDVSERAVHVCYGRFVDTGGSPVPGRTPAARPEATARLPCDIKLDYRAETIVDIFDGPLFELRPTCDGRVAPVFIPWHRQWSHSLVLALAAGLLAAAVFGPLAGLVAAGAYALHVVADQLGFMGSNLWFPFQRERKPGLGLVQSAHPAWNLFAVWLSGVIVFWNLYCISPFRVGYFNIVTLCFYALALPAGAYALLRRWARS